MEWLQGIIDAIGQWVPRLEIVRATHQGVAFVRGKPRAVIGPRLFFWWPVITELVLYPVRRQSLNPDPQPLTTKDGVTVGVSLVVIYEVIDILKALTKQEDLEVTVADKALLATARHVARSTFDELVSADSTGLEGEIKSSLRDWGVRVLEAGLVGCARGKVLFVLGDGGTILDEEED